MNDYRIYDILAQLANEQGNYGLALQCNHEKMISMYDQENEKQKLINEITNEVLKRISVSTDTNNAIKQIDGLNAALKRLGVQ
ncbi:MAG: hypothetical protein IJ455_04895 [Agathobacter sp.]|nr:hypothetical protein [Agathobacter sp.]